MIILELVQLYIYIYRLETLDDGENISQGRFGDDEERSRDS
jgi:hypothetical protein